MKIQCILIRDGGTRSEIGGVEYHFEPLADGAHVADVTDKSHIDRFLAIPEGYKLYHGAEEPSGKHQLIRPTQKARIVDAQTISNALLAGSEQLPPQFDINGRVVSQLDAVKRAFQDSGLSPDEWNDLRDDDRTAKIEIALDSFDKGPDHADSGQVVDAQLSTENRASLVKEYKAKFGKAPHGNASIETIKAKLAE